MGKGGSKQREREGNGERGKREGKGKDEMRSYVS